MFDSQNIGTLRGKVVQTLKQDLSKELSEKEAIQG
jgi:hypothetical protein